MPGIVKTTHSNMGSVFQWVLLYFICQTTIFHSFALHDGINPLVPDYDENYYYLSLSDKIIESLSINNCTYLPSNDQPQPDIIISEVAPSPDVTQRWQFLNYKGRSKNMSAAMSRRQSVGGAGPTASSGFEAESKGHMSAPRQFIQVSKNLCSSPQFLDYKKGFFKRAKGCLKMTFVDRQGKKHKVMNSYGATLHPEHARCDTKPALKACKEGSIRPTLLVSPNRSLRRYPFLVKVHRAIVARSGMLSLPCGPFGLFSSCEAVKWGVPIAAELVDDAKICRQEGERGSDSHCLFRKFNKVFVMSQYDDTQIGQFILESLPRLVYHLDWLESNPDVMIHYGFTKQPVLPTFALPLMWFKWLGLSERLINGTVYANEVRMPREGGCQDPGYNVWELTTMRETFLRRASHEQARWAAAKSTPKGTPGPALSATISSMSAGWAAVANITADNRPLLLLIKRSASPYTQNQADFRRRRWPSAALPKLMQSLEFFFPNHRVHMFSDLHLDVMSCPPCQLTLFHRADVVIGMHGAGLTNTLYMNAGGVVVEAIPEFDSRHAPITGIFPRLSAIAGLHHYSYYLKDVEFDPVRLANDSARFYNTVKMWEY